MVSPDAVGELSASIREIADKFPRQARQGVVWLQPERNGNEREPIDLRCHVISIGAGTKTGGGRGGFSFREERLSELI
jgi:hypothetical protein